MKKLSGVLLVLALVLSFSVVSSTTIAGAPDPGDYAAILAAMEGDGSEGSPYEVTTVAELQAVQGDLGAYYVLANDIDAAATVTWNEGAGFTPISVFTGSFDGKGFAISGLFFERDVEFGEERIGLFGETGAGAHLANIRLVDVQIIGGWFQIGSLVGLNRGTVANCHATGAVLGRSRTGGLVGQNDGWDENTGSITGSSFSGVVTADDGNDVGGLVGQNAYASIADSHSTGTVTARGPRVGGLVGYNMGSSVSGSYAQATVAGIGTLGNIGGLVGQNDDAGGFEGSIVNSYGIGTVEGPDNIGGLVGRNAGSVTDTYAAAEIVGGNWYYGGFVGRNTGSIENSYFDVSMSGPDSNFGGGGTAKTTEEMKDIVTFTTAGWDIGTTTLGDPTEGYPFLSWQVGQSSTWVIYEEPITECTDTFTDTGLACLTPSKGTLVDLQAVAPVSPAPRGVSFPHGMFEFRIEGLTPGLMVQVTIELPQDVPEGTVWWKHDGTRWYSLPNLDDNGDNIMVIELTDGGLGDVDGVADGVITDPGGPGNPVPPLAVGWEGSAVNRVAVMAPWIALFALIAGASVLAVRRRRAQT